MKVFKLVLCLFVAGVLSSCGSSSKMGHTPRSKADGLYNQGKYGQALAIYTTLDSASVDSAVFHHMSVAYMKCYDYENAISYARRSRNYDNAVLKAGLLPLVDSIAQHQMQTQLVVDNRDVFDAMFSKTHVDTKLVERFSETDDARIVALYEGLESSELRSQAFPTYLKNVKGELSDDELVELCKKALKDNPKQTVAQRYIGVELYNDAQARYEAAMATYNKKKNQTTYAYLMRDLKRISGTYREAKEYLNKVHAADPEDKNVIKYLININNRLDNAAEAKRLEKKL